MLVLTFNIQIFKIEPYYLNNTQKVNQYNVPADSEQSPD